MNYDRLKETIPHGDTLFPLKVHEIITDIRLKERLYCHWHDEIEILVVTNGKASFHIDAQTYSASKGDIFFISPDRLHSATGKKNEPWDFFAVVFSPSLLNSYVNDCIQQNFIDPVQNKSVCFTEHITSDTEWGKEVLSLLAKIKSAYEQKYTAFELEIKADLYKLWFLFFSHAQSEIHVSEINLSDHVSKIKPVLEYIQRKYAENITITCLASVAHMSKGQFCRFFKSMVKMSAIDYVTVCRINKSAELLLTTDKKISEIAGFSGFDTISYFNKVFRRYMHCTPKEFRKENDKDKEPLL